MDEVISRKDMPEVEIPDDADFEKFAKGIGIDFPGEVVNGRYVIPLMDSDEYSKVYTLLDRSGDVELDEGSTLVTDKVSELTYSGGGFDAKLDANFPDDFYRVVISRSR